MATKAAVKKAKGVALKLSKKFVLSEDAAAKIKAIDEIAGTGDFEAALAAVTAATAAIELCDKKAGKSGGGKAGGKDGDAADADDAAAAGGGAAAADAAPAVPKAAVPEVEIGPLEHSIDDFSAQGIAQVRGLRGVCVRVSCMARVSFVGAGTRGVRGDHAGRGPFRGNERCFARSLSLKPFQLAWWSTSSINDDDDTTTTTMVANHPSEGAGSSPD
jgi:hypothetical protein